ncbi:MAG: FtsX-like permease family protein, partial [Chloroflexi bacterium]|nr:FtsX-like permease family protein [Chloroflexota bacterium]
MLAPRWRKVFRDLASSKARTLLVILSIAVGVFAVGSVGGARVILGHDLAAAYDAANAYSAQISASDLDEAFVRSIARMPELSSAEGRSGLLLRVRRPDGSRSNVILYALHDFGAIAINRIRFEQGPQTPPLRQALFERSSLGLFDTSIGGVLTVELPDGKTRDIGVAGTVYDITAPPVRFANFGVGYISEETFHWLGFPSNFNQMRVVVADHKYDRTYIQSVADEIKKRIEDSRRIFYGATIPQNPGRHIADEQIQSMLVILNVLGALALFLSAFLVTNSISAIMAQHTRQIGIMKSIGARNGQIAAQYLAMVALLGIGALAIGLPAGSLGARGLAGFVANLLNFELLTQGIPTEVLTTQVLVGLAVPLLAAAIPITAGVRMTVREAISSTGVQSESTSSGGKSFRLFRFLPRGLLLSLRNTFRRKGRLALTAGTLVLAAAIFISVFSVRDALGRAMNDSLGYWNYDIEVNLKAPFGEDQVLYEMRSIPGVLDAEAWTTTSARRLRDNDSESRAIAVVAPPMPTERLHPVLLRGRWLTPEDGNAVVLNSDVLVDEPDLDVGSRVRLRFGERTREFDVVGIVQSTLTGQVRNPRNAYITQTGLRTALTLGRQTSNIVVVTSTHDNETRAAIARAIEMHFRARHMPVDTAETMSERRSQIAFQFDLLITFLLLMAALLAAVGGLGLAGTMSINVLERTREIGIMRAVGAGSGAIRAIVIGEGLLIGLLSWGIGALLAIPISALLNEAVGQAFLHRSLGFI